MSVYTKWSRPLVNALLKTHKPVYIYIYIYRQRSCTVPAAPGLRVSIRPAQRNIFVDLPSGPGRREPAPLWTSEQSWSDLPTAPSAPPSSNLPPPVLSLRVCVWITLFSCGGLCGYWFPATLPTFQKHQGLCFVFFLFFLNRAGVHQEVKPKYMT